jgi:aminoglycoside phosphotransferase (APT) family kinase protein
MTHFAAVDLQAAASCARELGTALPTVVQRGEDHVVFEAGEVIVKCGTRDAFAIEAWALHQAAELGIPAPEVVSLDTTSAVPHLAITKIHGVSLVDSRLTQPAAQAGAREAGELLRRLHDTSMPGFGWIDRQTFMHHRRVVGKSATWPDEIRAELDPALDLLTAQGALPSAGAEEVRARLRAATPLITAVTDGRLLHGDLGRMHIFVHPEDGRVAGLVDWGDLQVGDPLWDLAITECHFVSPSEGLLRRHPGERRGLFEHVLAGYQLSHADADRFSRLRDFYLLSRRAWVAALEARHGEVPEPVLAALLDSLR